MAPNLDKLPVIMSNGSFNAESLLSLHVDIVIIKNAIDQSKTEKVKLDSLGIPYLVVGYGNMQEQIYALKMIGAVCGEDAYNKANKIVDYYQSTIKEAEQISKKIPKDKRVRVYHSINQAVMTYGKNSLGNDWVSTVGAINVSVGNEKSMKYENNDYFASIEQIFVWDPNVIICNEVDTKEYLLSDSKWTDLRAIKDKKVYNIPVSATRWGQRGSVETFFALIWLGKTIYPEYYKDIDLKMEVTKFYKDIIGIDIDQQTYDKIISGKGIRRMSNASGA